MANPYLKSGEFIVLTTGRLSINAIPFDAILTTERLILVDNRYGQYEPQAIPLSSILTVKAGKNARDDPVITITFFTKSGEPVQKPLDLVFTQQYGEQRDRECNEWVRKCIEHIVLARKEPDSAKKRARRKETGMEPLVRRWVAPEMIHPHTTGEAPQPEPEDFVIGPNLLEAEPEPVGWDECLSTAEEESRDDITNPEPEECPQSDEPFDEPAYDFCSQKELSISFAPEPEPSPAPVMTPGDDLPAPAGSSPTTLEPDAGPAPVLRGNLPPLPEREPVTKPEIPEVAPETLQAIAGTGQSPSGPSDAGPMAKPDIAPIAEGGSFSEVLKKLVMPAAWTHAAETEGIQIHGDKSTSLSGRVPPELSRTGDAVPADGLSLDEMTPADVNARVKPAPSGEDHLHGDNLRLPDTSFQPVETPGTTEQEPVPEALPETAQPDMKPSEWGEITGPSAPPRLPTAMALIFVALLVIAGAAFLLVMPLLSGGGLVNQPPVIVTPSPAPVTMTSIPVAIPPTGTWVRVSYNGTFTGSIGNPYSLRYISGTGNQIYSPQMTSDIVQVSVQKQDYYGNTLNVWIYTNGTVIAQRSTRAPHGTIDLLIDIGTGKPPGIPVRTQTSPYQTATG